MKKALTVLMSLLLVMMFTGCSGSNEPQEEKDLLGRIQASGVLTIATEGDWAPWSYHDESGQLTGFDIEVGKLIAEKLGVSAKFTETDWDTILSGIDSGRFDIACNGVGYTESRAEKYRFTIPYVYTRQVLIVSSDNETITSFADIKGLKNANSASSTYAEFAESFGAQNIPVNTFEDTVDMLVTGKADCSINSEEAFNSYIKENPDAAIKTAASATGEKVAIPLKLDDDTKTLATAINKALDELRSSGQLAELSRKYFGADNTNPVTE